MSLPFAWSYRSLLRLVFQKPSLARWSRPARRLAAVWFAVISIAAAGPLLHAQTAQSGATVQVGSGFYFPRGVAVDGSGNVFVADYYNNSVKEIVAVNGVVSASSTVKTVASGFSGSALALDGSGNIFVAVPGGNEVYEIVAVNGVVSSDSAVNLVGSDFVYPYGVAVDRSGNVFVADFGARDVKEIVAVNGVVSTGSMVRTVGGGGFNSPYSVAVDRNGNLFVADQANFAVYEIVATNGMVSPNSTMITVASGIDVDCLTVDGSGNVFFTDSSDGELKEIAAVNGTVPSGSTVKTVARGFSLPYGVAVDSSGNIFIADSNNNAVKEIVAGAQKFPATPVGTASAPLTTYFTFTSSGTLASPPYVVLTQGAQGKDFQASASQLANACVSGQTYNAGDVCTVNVTFTPTLPYQRTGAIQLNGSSGTPIATFNLRGTGTGPQVVFPGNSAVTTAGSGFGYVFGVAVDGSGNVYVPEYYSGTVKEIMAINGVVSSGSAVNTVATGFHFPESVAVDGSGNVFVIDTYNNAVKEIVAVNGVVSSNSPVITLNTDFNNPTGVAVDGSGNVFVADDYNGAVKEIVAANGVVSPNSTVNTLASGFYSPSAVAVDGSGNVFVADTGNGAVKEIVAVNGVIASNPAVNTVGSGFDNPTGVAVDGSGNVFVADYSNDAVKEIVAVNGVVSMNSAVHTVGGNYTGPNGVAVDGSGNLFVADTNSTEIKVIDRSDPPTFTFASTPAGQTSSDSPQSVLFQNSGNATLSAVPPGLSVGANFKQVAGSGAVTDCTSSFSLDPSQACNLSISFTPQDVGPITSAVVLTDNALNASPSTSQSIPLTGAGIQVAPTIGFTVANQTYGVAPFVVSATSNSPGAITYSLVSGPANVSSGGTVTLIGAGSVQVQASQAASGGFTAGSTTASFSVGQAATATTLGGSINSGNTAMLTATVAPSATGTYPTAPGSMVMFYNNGLSIGSAPLTGSMAKLTTTAYTGSQTFTAMYNGDTNFTPSPKSNSVVLNFTTDPTITFTTAANYAYGQSFQLSATSNSPGAITYSLVSGPASVSTAGTVMITGEGPVVVQANEAATYSYNAGTKQASFNAIKASSSTALAASAVKSGNGTVALLSATVTPQYTGTPSGNVAFYDGSNVLTMVALSGGKAVYTTGQLSGPHTFSAKYSSDTNFNQSISPNVSLVVANTAVSLQFVSTKLVYPLPPAFVVLVSPAKGKPVPTGTVAIYDGTRVVGYYPLFAFTDGYAFGVVLPPLNVGQHSLTAVYSGDANYAPGTSTGVTVTVAPGPVKLSLNCGSGKLKLGQTLACNIGANEGALPVSGSVGYTLNNGTYGTLPLDKSGHAVFTYRPSAKGLYSITVTYAAQGNYQAAAPIQVSFSVN